MQRYFLTLLWHFLLTKVLKEGSTAPPKNQNMLEHYEKLLHPTPPYIYIYLNNVKVRKLRRTLKIKHSDKCITVIATFIFLSYSNIYQQQTETFSFWSSTVLLHHGSDLHLLNQPIILQPQHHPCNSIQFVFIKSYKGNSK